MLSTEILDLLYWFYDNMGQIKKTQVKVNLSGVEYRINYYYNLNQLTVSHDTGTEVLMCYDIENVISCKYMFDGILDLFDFRRVKDIIVVNDVRYKIQDLINLSTE